MRTLLLASAFATAVLLGGCQSSGPAASGAASGEHCGGNMANAPVCMAGYHCAPDPDSHLPFGDVGGICVAD